MAAGDQIVAAEDPRFDPGLLDVGAKIARPAAVERQVTAFGGDHDLLAPHAAFGHRLAQGRANRALAALAAIIDRGIDDVQAALERMHHRRLIARVVRVVVVAEVGPDSDGREGQAPEIPEIALHALPEGLRPGCAGTRHGAHLSPALRKGG